MNHYEKFDMAMMDLRDALRRADLPFLAMKVPVEPVRRLADFQASQAALETIYKLIKLRPPPARSYAKFMEAMLRVDRIIAEIDLGQTH